MKQGEIFLLTTGEYSDCGIFAALRAKKTFSFDREFKRYCDRHGVLQYRLNETAFVDELLARGLVEQYTIPEIHFSSYSTPTDNPADDASDDNP